MANGLSIDNCLIQVRSRLQEEGIKLWLEPYHVEGIGSNDTELESLASRLASTVNIPYNYCLSAINELQANAIDKLKARDLFNETGVATIKVRVPDKNTGGRLITVQLKLDLMVEDLYTDIAGKLELSPNKLKLISAGKMLNRSQTLQDQGIQNNQQIMAIILEMDEKEAHKENGAFDKLQEAKTDASKLLQKNDSYMDIEDQDGNVIHIPPEEKKAIMMALAIHEKGRAALRRNAYNDALIFLLEADNEYRICNSQLLETVDNYALLNLDIVWCYIMLKSISHLPDAEYRLQICERHFKKSYGENLNRVMTLKGNAANERALIMRMHLLQAILNFHKNQRNFALELLSTADLEWQQLQVNEGLVDSLVEMGFTKTEARTGLRACANNISEAIAFVHDRREKLEKARKLGREQRRAKNSLVKTQNKKWVNPRTLHVLSEMGFDKDLCALALQKTDNDINQSIALLQENQSILHDELLQSVKPDESLCEQIRNMGFDIEMIRQALKDTTNDMSKAIENLLQMQANGTYQDALKEVLKSVPPALGEALNQATTSAAQTAQDYEGEMKAYERFAEDMDLEDNAYLDLPLNEERVLLDEYKKMLDM
ncbi:NEDD8 ultimate buster 1 [Sitodiplosis mosellana]|uniref:NEDD8 ultimate buster 1 n=1 Tax=Sitodiplosis mosellana TaxID=263140 RepID=UPI002443CFB8|nr:NEDD8 ultimate buster 1 [Sitodiplosis mosellana]